MRIVVVEDNTTSLAVMCRLIGKLDGVEVVGFTTAEAALADAHLHACDLMVIDNIMPGMSGLDLVAQLRPLPTHVVVPIIMVTADGDRSTRLAAINAGATDFLAKPVDPVELKARVTNLLALRLAQNRLADRSRALADEVALATEHIRAREEEMIYRLARAIDMRDGETGGHVGRVAQTSKIIAETLGLDGETTRTIHLAAPLHDVGKIAIPDDILKKPGKLDRVEMSVMEQHTVHGAAVLAGGASELVRMGAAIALSHHERWDGTGYPQRLKGQAIPLAARIVAIADVLDALCSARPYKPAWPAEVARTEILKASGTQFDPICIAAFEQAWPLISALYPSPATTEAAA